MGFRSRPTALLLLLALGAGAARAEGGWTVRSPEIQRKARRDEEILTLTSLAAAAIVFWARRRPR